MEQPEFDVLLTEKRMLMRRIDRFGKQGNEQYTKDMADSDVKRLRELESEIRLKTQEVMRVKALEVPKMAAEEKVSSIKQEVKALRKAVDERYKAFTEEYVATKAKLGEMKLEKESLIAARTKLYAMKDKDKLNVGEQKVFDETKAKLNA